MNTTKIPALLLLVLAVAAVAVVHWSSGLLPERVATHFGWNGQPDGWMTRDAAVKFISAFAIGFPALFAGVGWLLGYLPASAFNLPHREYWLAPERRAATNAYIRTQMLWLACLSVCFVVGLHWLTIRANLETPARMPGDGLALVVGAFLAGLAAWVIRFVLHFTRPAQSQ